MLERQALLLEPWRRHPASGQLRRVIRDLATHDPIGFAAWRADSTPGWFHQLLPSWLDVFETEDASHLCSVEAPWLWRRGWRVRDAEERLVGRVWGDWLHDDGGELLGRFEHGKLLSMAGLELGGFARVEGVCTVQFQPALEGNPFGRMLLLAAAVTAKGP